MEDICIDTEPGQRVSVITVPGIDGKRLFEAVKKKSGGKITKLIHTHQKPIKDHETPKQDNHHKNKKEQQILLLFLSFSLSFSLTFVSVFCMLPLKLILLNNTGFA